MTVELPKTSIDVKEFVERAGTITTRAELDSLRADAVSTENLFRELFARHRESWEIPEIDDPHLLLVNVFEHRQVFRHLPRSFHGEDDDKNDDFAIPRCCFDLGEDRKSAGTDAIIPSKTEFELSWDCLTEGLLRFLNWDNVLAAGGAVAGCLAPLPENVAEGGPSATRTKRRKYFHDEFLPGSDVDLFLYGLSEEEAEAKLIEIFDAVVAANPFEVRAFRSAHAVTLVSGYPFRHVQIVLRLYNSPAEVLMGFDVDACAVGYDGKDVWVCPRTAIALVTQSNVVDMSRRSPSYEMRLAKYARRGFEVVVPSLDRERIDPFLYERRFDQTQGLARLLLLERLRTPEERLRYRIEGKIKRGSPGDQWKLRMQLNKAIRDKRNLDRREGTDGVPLLPQGGAEASDYSTVFLPWGPDWNAARTERLMKKKDKILNKVEFLPNGRVAQCRRPYKIHICAVGTMTEIMEDPYPEDPPVPNDVPPEALVACVRGELSWLVDNPGRQQIGSFNPITDGDWTEGAYISRATESFIAAAVADDAESITGQLGGSLSEENASRLLHSRDFLGRSVLHVAALARSVRAFCALLESPAVDAELLQARLADGRTALHLAAMRGNNELVQLILAKRDQLASDLLRSEEWQAQGKCKDDAATTILDIDGSDWEAKMNPLHYAVVFGHEVVVKTLLSHKANAKKPAVHKDRNESLSTLSLLALYASEPGGDKAKREIIVRGILVALLEAGASSFQIDTSGATCWHRLAENPAACDTLEIFLDVHAERANGRTAFLRALDLLNNQMLTALSIATVTGNHGAVTLLLKAGATACFSEEVWTAKVRQAEQFATEGRNNYYRRSNVQLSHCGPSKSIVTIQENYARCPIALAAQNADGPILSVFLEHDRTLANVALSVGTSNGVEQNKVFQPLDILADVLAMVKGTAQQKKNWAQTLKNVSDQVERARARCEEARMQRAKSSQDTYEHFAWSLITCREEQGLAKAEEQLKNLDVDEEDEEDEAKAIAQIEEARRILMEAGGESCRVSSSQEEGSSASTQTLSQFGMPPQFHGDTFPAFAMTPGFVPHSVPTMGHAGVGSSQKKGSDLQDPFQRFLDLSLCLHGLPYEFQSRLRDRRYRRRNGGDRLPAVEQVKACELMVASSIGSEEAIRSASLQFRVTIVDSTGATPLFMAVLGRNVAAVETLYKAAACQFRRHLEVQQSLKTGGAKEDEKDADPENVVKDQLRRINNIDLASGEQLRDGGMTPDQIRQKLEAAEAAALRQADATDSRNESPTSAISPQILLVHRSIVLTVAEPRLKELQARLMKVFKKMSNSDAVRLRPIELAVIRGDVDMVLTLLRLAALNLGSKGDDRERTGDEEKAEGKGDEEVSHDEVEHAAFSTPALEALPAIPSAPGYEDEGEDLDEEEYDHEDEDYDEEDYDEEYDDQRIDDGKVSDPFLQPHEMRWLITGRSSQHEDLGWLNLLQLAIACDDVPTFEAIVSFAQEYSLPNCSVAKWKDEVETSARKENCSTGDQTLLQFALAVDAKRVAQAIMSGGVDHALFGWLESWSRHIPKPRQNPNRRQCSFPLSEEGASMAAEWLKDRMTAGAHPHEIARRLIRPTAPDWRGRSALFYAPAELIPEVVASGTETILRAEKCDTTDGEKETSARTRFLEATASGGAMTALMAAVDSGEVERVEALLKAGCSISKPHGSKCWGPLHLVVPPKAAPDQGQQRYNYYHGDFLDCEEAEPTKDRMALAQEMIQLFIKDSSNEELDKALLCPGAEHTPLMVAADRGADGATLSLLMEQTASRELDALTRRDSELNSLLHLVVKSGLDDCASPSMSTACFESITSVLRFVESVGNGKALSLSIGPDTENARGITPVEQVLEVMASVWTLGSVSQLSTPSTTQRRVQMRCQRRNTKGKGSFPPPINSDVAQCEEKDPATSSQGGIPRAVPSHALTILDEAADGLSKENERRRHPVNLEDVQVSQRKTTEAMKASAAKSDGHYSPYYSYHAGDQDAADSNYRSNPLLEDFPHHYPRRNEWNGWPSP